MDCQSHKPIAQLLNHEDLDAAATEAAMDEIMRGEATDAQIGAFLMGMHLKGETIDEITGAVMVMRELATGVHVEGEHLVDIVVRAGQ